MDYKQAGVDIEEGYKAVGKYRELSAPATSTTPATAASASAASPASTRFLLAISTAKLCN